MSAIEPTRGVAVVMQPDQGRSFWQPVPANGHADPKLVRVVVDVPDTDENRQWVQHFKSRWKVRLKQLELWVVSYRIEIE